MNKKFGVGILIVCFGFSSVSSGWAVENIEVPPIIVQPDNIQALGQQTLNRDRQNRDQEAEIKELIEQNNELIQSTLAHQQDEGLAKVDQAMLDYRSGLIARDQALIAANGERWNSRYGDLIALTEDADDMTVHQDLQYKNGFLAEKYQMLTDLKDEMTSLNEKLENQQQEKLIQKEETITGFKKIAQEQQDKIQMLIARLDELDKKIIRLDGILAQKNEQIAHLKYDLSLRDETIKEQDNQIAILQGKSPNLTTPSAPSPSVPYSSEELNLSPIIVNSYNNQPRTVPGLDAALAAKDVIIKQQQEEIDLLQGQSKNVYSSSGNKVELPPIFVNHSAAGSNSDVAAKNEIIKQQENQIAILKTQAEDLSSRQAIIKSQADQIAQVSEQFKNQRTMYGDLRNQVITLSNKMQDQAADLKAKEDKIRWLNQVLTVARNEAQYYKLGSQQAQLSMQQVQGEVRNIKDDFAQRFRDYDQFENSVISLKHQVYHLSMQLSEKQNQVDALKSELENRKQDKEDQVQQQAQMNGQLSEKQNQVNVLKSELESRSHEEENQAQQQSQAQRDLKDQLQGKENIIVQMQANAGQVDERIHLAKQLIDLQQQESALLGEKNDLEKSLSAMFEHHATDLESKIQALFSHNQMQTEVLENRMQELQGDLLQKEQQVQQLNLELRNKITEEKNQGVLVIQIQDLNAQLQYKENQVASLTKEIQSGQATSQEADLLKQQLAAEQDKEDALKIQLENKTAESNKMTAMMADYQTKLESRDRAYSDQLGQTLSSKNYQVQMEKQVDDLSTRLQEKEAQVIKIKKEMYDLQEAANIKDRDTQAKDLSLSVAQQKTVDDQISEYQDKINGLQTTTTSQGQEIISLKTDLALAQQRLQGMPSSDEIEFLRTGLKKATAQLKQKDEALFQVKANADEYAREFKQQAQEFQSLKVQLANAQQEIDRKDQDLNEKKEQLDLLKSELENKITEGKRHGMVNAQVQALNAQLQAKEAQLEGIRSEMTDLQKTDKGNIQQIQNLKGQLADAQDELDRKNDDLKYKDLAIARLKMLSKMSNGDLQSRVLELERELKLKSKKVIVRVKGNDAQGEVNDLQNQIKDLSQKLDVAQERLKGMKDNSSMDDLRDQLGSAHARIKELQKQIDAMIFMSKDDRLKAKLRQALDQVDTQGHVIDLLVQKLHAAGQDVNLKDYFAKQY